MSLSAGVSGSVTSNHLWLAFLQPPLKLLLYRKSINIIIIATTALHLETGGVFTVLLQFFLHLLSLSLSDFVSFSVQVVKAEGSLSRARAWFCRLLHPSAKGGHYSKQLKIQIWTGKSHVPFDLESWNFVHMYISSFQTSFLWGPIQSTHFFTQIILLGKMQKINK